MDMPGHLGGPTVRGDTTSWSACYADMALLRLEIQVILRGNAFAGRRLQLDSPSILGVAMPPRAVPRRPAVPASGGQRARSGRAATGRAG